MESLDKKIAGISGFLRQDEAHLLCRLASVSGSNGVIVEIGSWEGKSTVCLGIGSLIGTKNRIYAIDPHTGSSEHKKEMGEVNTLIHFKKNILKAGVAKLVTPLVMTSHNAVTKVKEPVNLLFIDGAHDQLSVKQDFLDWFPKVVDGGIVAFHDTISWPGPRKVVADYVFKSRDFKNVRVVGSITYGVKTKDFTIKDFFTNRYVYVTKCLREFISQVKLPSPIHNLAKKIYYEIQ